MRTKGKTPASLREIKMPAKAWFEKGARVMLEPDTVWVFYGTKLDWFLLRKDQVGEVVGEPLRDLRRVRWPDGSEDDLHINYLVNA